MPKKNRSEDAQKMQPQNTSAKKMQTKMKKQIGTEHCLLFFGRSSGLQKFKKLNKNSRKMQQRCKNKKSGKKKNKCKQTQWKKGKNNANTGIWNWVWIVYELCMNCVLFAIFGEGKLHMFLLVCSHCFCMFFAFSWAKVFRVATSGCFFFAFWSSFKISRRIS